MTGRKYEGAAKGPGCARGREKFAGVVPAFDQTRRNPTALLTDNSVTEGRGVPAEPRVTEDGVALPCNALVFQFANAVPKNRVRAMIPSNAPTAGPEANPDAILLVDDEQPLLDMYLSALSPKFDVVVASNAREADVLVRQRSFKVVVADHLMPGETGMNFLVRMREEFPHMQRVLVTGYMKPEMLLRSVTEAAVFRFLTKPISMSELIGVIHDAARAHDASLAATK
jgi:CheY-like chemotaxis protein